MRDGTVDHFPGVQVPLRPHDRQARTCGQWSRRGSQRRAQHHQQLLDGQIQEKSAFCCW